jgi:hypothetical protein
MNSSKTPLARAALTLFAGMMFWSSWSLQAARHAAPPAALKPLPRATGLPVLSGTRQPGPEQKLRLGQRLSQVVADPSRIAASDLEAVSAAWGSDSSRMLALLRETSR